MPSKEAVMLTAGQQLRALREQLGFTIREVEAASERLAQKHNNDEYVLNLSRLSDIETKGVLPTIFRLYSLATIYRVDILELLKLYGISSDPTLDDRSVSYPARTHKLPEPRREHPVNMPATL